MTRFDQLIGGLCALTGFAAPQRIIGGGAICYEQINFSITVDAAGDLDTLLVYADFGALDLEKKAMLYPLMLKENAMMLHTRNCTFGVSELYDHVVLIEKMSLATTTPQLLLATMRSLARKANYFNKQHYRPSLPSMQPRAQHVNALQSQQTR